jgi:glycosyltransferase involved in cell wall biosynthesis
MAPSSPFASRGHPNIMKVLLLIPSVRKTNIAEAVAANNHPTMDYDALASALESGGDTVTIADFTMLENAPEPLVQAARKRVNVDAALAVLGFVRRKEYDVIFCNSESTALPLALLFKGLIGEKRPGHVAICHRLTPKKKKPFFTILKADQQIDTLFVYSSLQKKYAEETLGIPKDKVPHIQFHADIRFFAPQHSISTTPKMLSAAGLEWRDYLTMITALTPKTDWIVKLAAASPWAKHANETEKVDMPPHIAAQRYPYDELRTLYAESEAIVVPLKENDFQAGITAILEAMAMEKPVIVTKTTGQTDVIIDGVNGLYVPVGDTDAMQKTLERVLSDATLRETLGKNGRRWVEENATQTLWAEIIAKAIRAAKK